jgi:hypothetical protein
MRAAIVATVLLAIGALGAAPVGRADGATGRIAITPTIDPPGEVSGQALPSNSRFKVRDADGHVVAQGGIDGSGGDHGNYQTAYVDLPPGEYTVEIHYHSPGDRHAEGTRDYKGTKTVKVRPGATALHQIPVQPRNPAQHLSDRIQLQEDLLADAEATVRELEEDIRRHRDNGEEVGDEHTDMLDDAHDDVDTIEARLRRMRRRLRDMRAERLQRNEAGKAATRGTPKVTVPNVQKKPQGQY